MRACILKDWQKAVIEDVNIPELSDDEVLVKVEYAGICGTELHVYDGRHPTAKCPVVMGHEFSGTITKINTKKETELKVGDRVVAQPYLSCGVCDPCSTGKDNVCASLKIFGVHTAGCFADYVKVPLRKTFKIPEKIDFKTATMVEPLAVAVYDVNMSGMQFGDTVLVIGGGSIGVLAAIVARKNGALKVVVSEINETKLKFLNELGFETIDPLKVDALEEAKRMTDGKGFDIVFETSGTQSGTDLMMGAAKNTGKIVFVGVPNAKHPTEMGAVLAKELKIIGVRLHSEINFKRSLQMLEDDEIRAQVSKLITLELPLEEVEEGIRLAKIGEHFKIILKCS